MTLIKCLARQTWVLTKSLVLLTRALERSHLPSPENSVTQSSSLKIAQLIAHSAAAEVKGGVALYRSRLLYGHEAFFTASPTWLLSLERVELAALKVALGLSKGAVNDLVYQELGWRWLPLGDAIRRGCANFETRVHAVPNGIKSYVGQDTAPESEGDRERMAKKQPSIHMRTAPLSTHTKPLWEECGTQPE